MNARAHRNTGISINFIHLVFNVIQAMFFPHRKNFYILLLISVNARAIMKSGFSPPEIRSLQYGYVIDATTTEHIFILLLHV